ncbi:MAG: 50S ribosomal protein L29 [Deltaproteobacteria bacterium]|nr:50S ribosomal protein L29 [Deltaproteobacteria bacterium]
MKATELREMALGEIKTKEAELKKELFNLRMRHATNQLENPLKLRIVRRDIAKIKTVIAEKERSA